MEKLNFLYFIGIDISKATFDVAILKKNTTASFKFENNNKGIRAFITLLKNQKITLNDTLICMEHTGVYGRLIIQKLLLKKALFCVEMPLRIINSMGIQRGKNDRIDAIKIAKYAAKMQIH